MAKKKNPLDYEKAAGIVVDTMLVGAATAAARWKVSVRTVERYRQRHATDPVLAERVAKKIKVEEKGWRAARHRFLNRAIGKLEELVDAAGTHQIRQVAGAIKIVGELEIAGTALGDGLEPESDSTRAGAAAARGGAEARSTAPVH